MARSSSPRLSPRRGTTIRTLRPARDDSHSSSIAPHREAPPARAPPAAASASRRTAAAPRRARRPRSRPTPRSPVHSSTRSTTRPPRTWKTCTTAPAGPIFTPKASRSPRRGVAIFCWRSRSVSTVRIASRSCAACSKRSLDAAVVACATRGRRSARRAGPRGSSRASATARPVFLRASRVVATHGARQRLMSYSRHGRPRCPVMTSLHERRPNSRCDRLIVRRASDAGRNGPE